MATGESSKFIMVNSLSVNSSKIHHVVYSLVKSSSIKFIMWKIIHGWMQNLIIAFKNLTKRVKGLGLVLGFGKPSY